VPARDSSSGDDIKGTRFDRPRISSQGKKRKGLDWAPAAGRLKGHHELEEEETLCRLLWGKLRCKGGKKESRNLRVQAWGCSVLRIRENGRPARHHRYLKTLNRAAVAPDKGLIRPKEVAVLENTACSTSKGSEEKLSWAQGSPPRNALQTLSAIGKGAVAGKMSFFTEGEREWRGGKRTVLRRDAILGHVKKGAREECARRRWVLG